MQPRDWNAVVLGYWNPAILNPAGILERLFGLPRTTPVEIEVPMDGVSPLRVVKDGCRVSVDADKLVVSAIEADYASLQTAAGLAEKAVAALPETPVTAAGLNLRFSLEQLPAGLLSSGSSDLDAGLSDDGLQITRWTIGRKLQYGANGVVNIKLQQDAAEGGYIEINFHLGATDHGKLAGWLRERQQDVEPESMRLLAAMGLLEPEEDHD